MKKKKILSLALLILFVLSTLFLYKISDKQANKIGSGNKIFSNGLLPPKDLKVPTLAYNENSLTLVWSKPDTYSNIVDYNVYMDGKLLGKASENSSLPAKNLINKFYSDTTNSNAYKISIHNYTVTGLKPNTSHSFTVRSVNSDGKESSDSNSITHSTTAEPEIFDVTKYGAVGDGKTLDTKAIQKAIDSCTAGGKVLLPQGKTFKSGSLTLKSDIILEINGTLLDSNSAADYPYPDSTYKTVTKTTALISGC